MKLNKMNTNETRAEQRKIKMVGSNYNYTEQEQECEEQDKKQNKNRYRCNRTDVTE